MADLSAWRAKLALDLRSKTKANVSLNNRDPVEDSSFSSLVEKESKIMKSLHTHQTSISPQPTLVISPEQGSDDTLRALADSEGSFLPYFLDMQMSAKARAMFQEFSRATSSKVTPDTFQLYDLVDGKQVARLVHVRVGSRPGEVHAFESYCYVGPGDQVRFLGQSLCKRFPPGRMTREFTVYPAASRSDKNLFRKVRLAARKQDGLTRAIVINSPELATDAV